jgi:hypothetical protein
MIKLYIVRLIKTYMHYIVTRREYLPFLALNFSSKSLELLKSMRRFIHSLTKSAIDRITKKNNRKNELLDKMKNSIKTMKSTSSDPMYLDFSSTYQVMKLNNTKPSQAILTIYVLMNRMCHIPKKWEPKVVKHVYPGKHPHKRFSNHFSICTLVRRKTKNRRRQAMSTPGNMK